MFRGTANPPCRVHSIVCGVSGLACSLALLCVTRASQAQSRPTTSVVVEFGRENRAIVYPNGGRDLPGARLRCEETCTLDLVPGEYVVEFAPARLDASGVAPTSQGFTVGRSPLRVVHRGRPVGPAVLAGIGGAALTVGAVLGVVAILGSLTHFGPDPSRSWTAEGIAGGVCFAVGLGLFIPGIVLSNPVAIEPMNDHAGSATSAVRRVRWSIAPGTAGSPLGVSVSIVHF